MMILCIINLGLIHSQLIPNFIIPSSHFTWARFFSSHAPKNHIVMWHTNSTRFGWVRGSAARNRLWNRIHKSTYRKLETSENRDEVYEISTIIRVLWLSQSAMFSSTQKSKTIRNEYIYKLRISHAQILAWKWRNSFQKRVYIYIFARGWQWVVFLLSSASIIP